MRVVVTNSDRRVDIENRPEPSPDRGEIVLRLLACGLCGTDLHKIARGTHVGRVLGHEVVGEVISAGEEVERFSIGDRVAAPHHLACGRCRLCRAGVATRCDLFRREQLHPGGFSECIRVGADAVLRSVRRLPEGLSTEAAVFLEPAACVLRGIDHAGLGNLDADGPPVACLILGAGSMGLLHLLLLRTLSPAAEIVVSEPHDWRRQQAERLGADRAVAPEDLDATVASVAGGEGFDAAFDTVGAPELVLPTIRRLRSGGTMVLFAHPRAGPLGEVSEALFSEERRLVGTYSGALDEQQRAFDLLSEGRLDPRPLVTHRVALDRFANALALAQEPQALKILLVRE